MERPFFFLAYFAIEASVRPFHVPFFTFFRSSKNKDLEKKVFSQFLRQYCCLRLLHLIMQFFKPPKSIYSCGRIAYTAPIALYSLLVPRFRYLLFVTRSMLVPSRCPRITVSYKLLSYCFTLVVFCC